MKRRRKERKPTVAEQREKAIYRLAKRRWPDVSEDDLSEAQYDETIKIMNSYYRLCGLDERLLYLQNEEPTCNLASTKREEERALKWVKRLNEWLEPYDAHLEYFGYCPTICAKGTTQDLYLAYFYE